MNNLTQIRLVEEAAEDVIARSIGARSPLIRIPVVEIAKSLGLQIRYEDLSRFGKETRSVLLQRDNLILVSPGLHRRLAALAIAHEIGHWYFKDHSGVPTDAEPGGRAVPPLKPSEWFWRERRANYFGGALVIPQSKFAQQADAYPVIDARAFRELAEAFDVSMNTLKIRLDQLHPMNPDRIGVLPALSVDWASIRELVHAQEYARTYFVSNRRNPTSLSCPDGSAPIESIAADELPGRLEQLAKLGKTDVIWGGLDLLDWSALDAAAALKDGRSLSKIVVVCRYPIQARSMAHLRWVDNVLLCEDMDQVSRALLAQISPFISAVAVGNRNDASRHQAPVLQWAEHALASNIGSRQQPMLPINVTYPDVAAAAQYIRESIREHKQVALALGCFDILHAGHLEFLDAAKEAADVLVVGVEDDARVRAFKQGKDGTAVRRPHNHLGDRIRTLQALRCVDFVFAIHGPIKPDDPADADRFYRKLYRGLHPTIVALTEGDPLIDLRKKQIKAAGIEPRTVCTRVGGYSTSEQIIRIVKQVSLELHTAEPPNEPTLAYERVIGASHAEPRRPLAEPLADQRPSKPFQLSFNF